MTPLPDGHPHDRDAAGDESDAAGDESDADRVSTDSPDVSDPKAQFAILLLEDNQDQAEPLRDILQFAGYRCVIARDVASAREELAKPDQLFAIMVADLNLTRNDHAAFVRDVRSLPRYATLPVIIATGHDSRQAREQARFLGRTEYLVKPYASATLLQLIARWTRAKP